MDKGLFHWQPRLGLDELDGGDGFLVKPACCRPWELEGNPLARISLTLGKEGDGGCLSRNVQRHRQLLI